MSNEDKLNQIFDEINSIGFKGSNEFELHLKDELLKWMNEVSKSAEVTEGGTNQPMQGPATVTVCCFSSL